MRLSDTLSIPTLGRPPDGSREDFGSLSFSLISAKTYVQSFETALDLFASTQKTASAIADRTEKRRYRDFSFIAARDGAMSLYHYSKTAEHCGTLGHRLAQHSVYYDNVSFRTAKRTFEKAFPNVVNIRDAVGHSAEITQQERDKHVITGALDISGIINKDSGRLFIMNTLNGDEFINTYMGKLISYKINRDSLGSLVACCKGLFDAFQGPDASRA